ncbi:actin-like protein 8 [Octodon degus]|uniref:Actin-like protein 8 n=1 Tax=Octodon degus TaxID=10160 RepID=A0A6P3FHM9_OCTDE|nr:actin-like protein 8 [Octodon degus]
MATSSIIIDQGSGFLKVGLSGWNQPHVLCPSIVNYIPCQENPGPSSARRQVSMGIDPYNPDTFSRPIQRGRVINWEGVEHMWSFALQRFKEHRGNCPVILNDSLLKEPEDRRKTLEIMFELQQVPALLLADELEMSLYSTGLLTGVVVDSGYGLTRIQPFFLGQSLSNSRRTMELAGQDLSTYLFKNLFKEKCDEHNLYQMETVARTQTTKCYVPKNLQEALNFHQSLPNSPDKGNNFQLPDGTPVELPPLARLAPEMFFNPQVFGQQGPGLPQVLVESIKSCEVPRQLVLLSHVVPCGGNSLYPGLTRRLSEELNSGHFPYKATVWVGEHRRFSVWLGASVVAHFSSYKSQWLRRQEYLESMRL